CDQPLGNQQQLPIHAAVPGGRMPPSTAARMAAATKFARPATISVDTDRKADCAIGEATHEPACSAGFPACGFTGLSSPVDQERATGKSPEPAGSKACATNPPRFMVPMRAKKAWRLSMNQVLTWSWNAEPARCGAPRMRRP